jgi:hypothetical protein
MECPQRQDPREREICVAISHEIRFAVWGKHAPIALSFVMPGGVVPKLYCALHIIPADTPALQSLSRSTDFRLGGTAEDLGAILKGRTQPLDSVYHPDNRDFPLKNGCPSQAPTSR